MEEARLPALVVGLVAEQGDGERVLHEGGVQVGDDLGGRRGQPGEQVEHAGVDVRAEPALRRDGTAREVVEVVALVGGEPQRPREGREHLLGRLRAGAPLQLVVVVHRGARELGHLVAAQPGHAAARPGDEPDVLGTDPLAPGAEERAQLGVLR